MRRDSRNSRPLSQSTREAISRAQDYGDRDLDRYVPRKHKFVVFRLTEDICAKCHKPRKPYHD